MNFDEIPYPCIGYCITDSRGYCVGCGRPPTLGRPEPCASKCDRTKLPADPDASPPGGGAGPE